MVEFIQNTNFSIQFVLNKINANERPTTTMGMTQQQQQPRQLEERNQNVATTAIPSPVVVEESKQEEEKSELEAFEAKDITNGRAFMSNIIRISLRWKEPKRAELPASIIMKVPGPQKVLNDKNNNMDDNTEEKSDDTGSIEFLISAHSREIQFYECFPRLEPALRLPKFYFGSDYHPSHREGIILMEDLSPRATTVPVLPGFSDAQVLALLREIARLHATAWRHPEWEQHINGMNVEQNEPALNRFFEEMRDNAKKLVEIDAHMFGTLVGRLLPMFTMENGGLCHYTGTKYGFPASVVHGDLWAANVLWELEEKQQQQPDGDGEKATTKASAQLCAIIDWQTVHAGNCCEDICRVLSLNTSGMYRRQNTERLLAFYAQQVAKFMGGTERMPFTIEQLKDAYKHAMPFTIMYFCFGVPFYHGMDSVVGKKTDANGGNDNNPQRESNQRELLQRCQMFMEDTAAAFGL